MYITTVEGRRIKKSSKRVACCEDYSGQALGLCTSVGDHAIMRISEREVIERMGLHGQFHEKAVDVA
jgi:hypothetical protein